MRRLTRPGGHVYIEVPDACRYVDHLVAPFHDFNTEHINHFSGQTLQLAMELAGFATEHLGTKDVMCSPRDTYPAIFGLFRRDEETGPAPEVTYDEELPRALALYVTDSEALLDRITTEIRAQLGDRSVVVWGAGQLSMKLLSELSDREVIALVDTSESKWGLHFGELVVVGPNQVPDGTEPILITSIHHQESIEHSIQSILPGREYISLRS